MATSIEGTYRNGQVELNEPPAGVANGTPVIVTFLESGHIDLQERGIDQATAADLRSALSTFVDWDEPDMAVYDEYDAAKSRL